ncbi:D-alanine--D-alanine ligase [Enterobacteriaceae endosymbiont of Donacia cincticornis]|uniref:D-alanine--D-alanine ligase n=1 Tax=Enterobacteriaceae endosymbiont of Donacia cincticornis TaxID=2675773 RepID=UPI0014499093|nr:D-alanine--D-alanine ligase [Enterobacteriaceae endosymbiont of Donacia cincticornis]QJC36038.1 D-alanine--D-alanine ligase [Enterobacteriaceae endosymbiont of Donacia cincticornis]
MSNKIVVLFGGNSLEREISLKSGKSILNILKKSGINVIGIDPNTFPLLYLKKFNFKKAFIALHGKGGEDGTIQGILEYLNIPYTGSGVLSSAITINKFLTKIIWKEHGLPIIYPHLLLNKKDFIKKNYLIIEKKILQIKFPIIIKPNCSGSSLGVFKVNHKDDLFHTLEKSFVYDNNILIEKYLKGIEYTIGVLNNKILPPIKIGYSNIFYDYQSKYYSNNTEYFCPSGLNKNKEKELENIILKAWKVLNCKIWGRIDVILDENKNFQLLEINTIPGMTPKSLYPIAARKAGLSFYDLIMKILFLTK